MQAESLESLLTIRRRFRQSEIRTGCQDIQEFNVTMSTQPDLSFFMIGSHRGNPCILYLFGRDFRSSSNSSLNSHVPTSIADQKPTLFSHILSLISLHFNITDLRMHFFKMILQICALIYNVFMFKFKEDSFVLLDFNLSMKNVLPHTLTSLL